MTKVQFIYCREEGNLIIFKHEIASMGDVKNSVIDMMAKEIKEMDLIPRLIGGGERGEQLNLPPTKRKWLCNICCWVQEEERKLGMKRFDTQLYNLMRKLGKDKEKCTHTNLLEFRGQHCTVSCRVLSSARKKGSGSYLSGNSRESTSFF